MAQTAVQPSSTEYDAQTSYYGRDRNVSVLERPRPDYEAIGIHEGGLTIYPALSTGVTYTDNVYETETNTVADEYFTIHPSITALSNWGRHGLRLYADATNEQYVSRTSENQTAYSFRADGRIDVHGQSAINLGVSADHAFEARGNIYALQDTQHPVQYDTQNLYARGSYVQDRIRLTLDGEAENMNYYNAPLVGGGEVLENTRNEHIFSVMGRTDYALTPDTALFGSVTWGQSNYLVGSDINRRDSHSVQALGGVNFDLTSLARGEIGVGYFERDYSSNAYPGMSGFSTGIKIEYFPTTLVTVTLLVQRRPQDAAFVNSSGGFFQNSGSIGADYEFRRNWIWSASVGYETDDFQGVDRHDSVANVVVSSRYYLTRTVGVGADLSYADRESTGTYAGPAYKNTKVGVFVVFQR